MEVVSPVVMVLLIYRGLAVAQHLAEYSLPINNERAEKVYITKQNQEKTEYTLSRENVKPIVHVCCPPDLYFKNQKCIEKEHPAPALEFPDVYTANLEPSSMTVDDFNQTYLYPCADGSYGLFPGEDEFYLLENGTVIQGNLNDTALINQNEYCLAQLANDDNSRTVIVGCYPPESCPRLSVKEYLYGIGSSASATCLAATFFVYAALPELQNQSGLIVMTYVVMLMFGNVLLVVNIFSEVKYHAELGCHILGNYTYSVFTH